MGVNEKILEAIGICAENIVKKAGYNKTIQAQIISCQDATIGKYKCKFQDAIFYAYNTNTEVSYTDNTNVYVLIPSNDMGKEKIILGTSKKLGINYISQTNDDEAYELVGQNCFTGKQTYYLDTDYRTYLYDIYNYERDKEKQKEDLPFDIEILEYNLKHSSSMLIGANIKTTIENERQHNGHYGIEYVLVFYDNVYKKQVKRTYIMDEDSMISNPYKLVTSTRQYQIFNIDGDNFVRIDSISIFNSDFPQASKNKPEEEIKLNSGDIILNKFELYGANGLSEQQINGVAITFYTPQGTFFTTAEEDKQKVIVAQVRVKGKLASSSQDIPFFWGRQNVKINTTNQKYNKYLGRGWECLNSYNVSQSIDDEGNLIEQKVEWVPDKDTYILNIEDAPARKNRLKVAIVYEKNIITKTINIQNFKENALEIIIQSDDGTEFHHDIGHPNLTCIVKNKDGEIQNEDNYSYYWSCDSISELNKELETTNTQNDEYQSAISNLQTLKNQELTSSDKYKKDLQKAEQAVQKYDYIQRVEKNHIYNVQIRQIINFKTFKCSVYNGTIFLGTGQITLTNKLESENLYSLVINNGSIVYQYNENGIAPNNKTLQNPQAIPALTFNLYDDNGKLVDVETLIRTKECQVTWLFPKGNDTLLVATMRENDFRQVQKENTKEDEGKDQQEPKIDNQSNQNFIIYKNTLNLIYDIETKYNINKQNNQIILNVKYKGKDVTARTNFTFTKQGQPGTNGTEYIVKIIPNTNMNNPPLYPIITNVINGACYLNYGIETNQLTNGINFNENFGTFPLIGQLWKDGEKQWSTIEESDQYIANWEVLQNITEIDQRNIKEKEQNVLIYKNSNIEINNNSFKIKNTIIQDGEPPIPNIVKCSITYQDKTYYGTIPIITAEVEENYRIKLKDHTGFMYVIYTSDGVYPQYDTTNPFEIICEEKIDNVWEDISLATSDKYKLEYEFKYNGSVPDLLINMSERYKDTLQKNQAIFKPIDRFDGNCTSAAVTCTIKQNKEDGTIQQVAYIHIPIHFLLNKYSLSYLNAWDGNSIQINNDGGYILAPQMGAGTKDKNNCFTGVLMGEIVQSGKNNQFRVDKGLMGFHEGQRSFFIDSESGGAFFGLNNQGQIIIDPSSKQGLIYSGNFFKNYNDKGFPENYVYRTDKFKPTKNGNKEGMIINLTEPEIYFGSGNFYVTKDGYIHAAGGGDIAGWNIKDDRLYTTDGKGRNILTLQSSSFSSIYELCSDSKPSGLDPNETDLAIQLTEKYKNEILYLKRKDGSYIAIGNKGQNLSSINNIDNLLDQYEFYNYNLKETYFRKFKTEQIQAKHFIKGYLLYTFKQNEMVQQGKIFSNTHDSLINTSNGFYLSDDGLSIGSKVKITQDGVMKLGAGAVADANEQRYWTIDGSNNGHSYISYGTDEFIEAKSPEAGANSVYLGTDGISLNNRFSVDSSGKLIAVAGTVGGWSIDNTTITGGSLILHNTGWIEGSGWRINSSGFYSGSDADGQGFSNSGFKLNGSSLTSPGGIISSSGSGCLGGTSLNASPLTWTKTGVTLRGSTEIINGAKIGGFEITDNNISAGSNANNATVIRPTSIQTNDLTINNHIYVNRPSGLGGGGTVYGRTGTLTFSDQSKMYFSDGILVGVSKGTNSETTWNGD